MPAQIIEDDSIGNALGMLYKGFAAGSDPKRKAEALALQAIIDQRGAATQQTEIENINLMRQRQAQNESIKAIGADLESGRAKIAPTITAPAPDAEFIGPMPQMPNPRVAEFDQRLATARAIANNAILRGGSPTDAATAAWKSLGLGQVYTQGLPTNEPGARELQTIIGGDIPRADVPLTEQQRLVMATEKANQEAALKQMETQAAMERERLQQEQALVRQRQAPVIAPQNSTVFMTREEKIAKGLDPDKDIPVQRSAGKDEIVETPGRPDLRGYNVPKPGEEVDAPLFRGTGEQSDAWNILNRIVRKHRTGQPLTEDEMDAYASAKSALFPFKSELRIVGGESKYVPIRTQMPRRLAIPNLVDEADIIADAMSPGARAARPPVVAPDTEIPGASVPAPVSAVPVAQGEGITGVPGETVVPDRHPYTESARKDIGYLGRMQLGHALIDSVEKGTGIPGKWEAAGSAMLRSFGGKVAGDYGAEAVTTDKLLNYESAARTFLVAVLRLDTGAAAPVTEYPDYYAQFIPRPTDPPELREKKRISREVAMGIMEGTSEGAKPEEILARVQQQVGRIPPGAAGTPAPTKTVPEGTSAEQLRVGAQERKAIIDAYPNMAPDEKARRKAAVDALLERKLKEPGVK